MLTEIKYRPCSPEVWGGVECTINRVGDNFCDQLHDTGHYNREGDIEHFAALGITKMRYPVLWESHQEDTQGSINWTWITGQLEKLRQNNIVPVAGLLHHGSGPVGTDLLDDNFPAKLAVYAGKVARQFPWITYYTPVNEPLTTARFSGLYGFWYPHHTNERSFAKMLLNQLTATVLSMQAIRRINPDAKLVQTEDLSKTHSTPLLAYQALFENNRRWLTYDILCGCVNRQHTFWNYFVSLGIPVSALEFFIDNKCPPDIIGFNYYVTSERYLDENLHHYPETSHGGNGRHRYADIEAVRAGHMAGLTRLLEEAWKRFRLPMAVTECYLNCTREEQLRWLNEIWITCCTANKNGIPVKAVTAWSLLGSHDWDSLLLRRQYHYETGVFDIRHKDLRPTLLAKMIHSLSTLGFYQHPLLDQPGWWNRTDDRPVFHKKSRPLLLIGNSNVLVEMLVNICRPRAIHYILIESSEPAMLTDKKIVSLIEMYQPWGIIYTGNLSNGDADAPGQGESNEMSKSVALFTRTCRKFEMPLMVFNDVNLLRNNSCTSFSFQDITRIDEPDNTLVIEYQSIPVINDIDIFGDTLLTSLEFPVPPTYLYDLTTAALDLFIDEEKGKWQMNTNGGLMKTDINENVDSHVNKICNDIVDVLSDSNKFMF